jgi:hypothetical protein
MISLDLLLILWSHRIVQSINYVKVRRSRSFYSQQRPCLSFYFNAYFSSRFARTTRGNVIQRNSWCSAFLCCPPGRPSSCSHGPMRPIVWVPWMMATGRCQPCLARAFSPTMVVTMSNRLRRSRGPCSAVSAPASPILGHQRKSRAT